MVVDLFLVFNFIKRLVTPFTKWEAYKEGIIDEKGNILIKRKDFVKNSQKLTFRFQIETFLVQLLNLLQQIPLLNS
mgnify:CR=1 FL=1